MIKSIFEFLNKLFAFFIKVKEEKAVDNIIVQKQETISRKDDNERLVEKASTDPIALEEMRRRLGE